MADKTGIEWCDATFNAVWGCSKVSPGCDHCYAETLAKRYGFDVWDNGKFREFGDKHWNEPLKWNAKAERAGKRLRVFCNSMADVFDNRWPEGTRERLWGLIEQTPRLDWLLLTKRIGNAARMVRRWPDNVWLGISVVNQEEADRDIPKLLAVPARVRFISYEPALGPFRPALSWLAPGGIDWIICGGESGPKARPMHPQWARDIRDICWRTKTAFFFKQWGEWREWDHGSKDSEVDADSEEADAIFISAVRPGFVTRDGRFFAKRRDIPDDETPCRLIERVGKKAAGRLLDGREWNEFPLTPPPEQS